MARLAATAVLLLSLLAVANCRVLEEEPETAVAISDEQGQAEPFIPQDTVAADVIPRVPTDAVGEGEGILRLPSHRRPCRHGLLHRHLRWARHHGLSHRRGAFPGPVLPEEPKEAELEAVAEPDPDTRPDTDAELIPFHGEVENGEENGAVKAWKGEMLRRFHGHGLRFHHHHEQAMPVDKDDIEDQEQQEEREEGAGGMHLQHVKMFSRHFHHHHGEPEQDKEEGAGGMAVKLFRRRFHHHHHHHHGDEEQDEMARKHYFHHHHDSDSEVDEVEDLARRLSEAIMRRSLGRHHLHHHHAEEGGVKKWFRGLLNMNRF